MIQDRVLKIIRGLNTFSSDDILVMCDVNEDEAEEILAELVKEEKIIPIGSQYKYLNKTGNLKSSLRLVKKTDKKTILNKNVSFKDAAEYFLTNHVLQNCSPTTFKTYKSLIKHHLNPFFGKMEIKSITQEHIKEFIELKLKEGLQNKRINSCLTLFGNMFNKFKEWEFISDSPYNGIINVKFSREVKIQVLNNYETDILLKTAKTFYPKLYLFVLLILSSGIKKSELLALKKQDINLKNLKINVNKTMFANKIIIPKVKTIIRHVDIPKNIVPEVKKAIKGKTDDDFVLYDRSLSWFTQDRQMRIDFSKLVKQLKLPYITFNDLRHTYAYDALQNGISIDYLHKHLGDYSIQSTMDKYREFINL